MKYERAPLAEGFARQIVETAQPFISRSPDELAVLDVGCGYGDTASALAQYCRQVEGIEPSSPLAESAKRIANESNQSNLSIRHEDVYNIVDKSRFDLIVLDNVLEHLADQEDVLERLSAALKPGGAIFILVPNKLWPIEVHYGLPFLSYLPIRLANFYLRLSGKGVDFTDASYAPSYWRMRRLLKRRPELTAHFTPPADVSLATLGSSRRYRLGVAAITRFPILWSISKALLVVAVKRQDP